MKLIKLILVTEQRNTCRINQAGENDDNTVETQ